MRDIKPKGLVLVPRPDDSPDQIVTRYARLIRNSGILKEYSDRSRFRTNREKRKTKHERAAFRRQQEESK